MTATRDETWDIGYAATWCHATGTCWFTSDEFIPAVVVHSRDQECGCCGSALPCPHGVTENDHLESTFVKGDDWP